MRCPECGSSSYEVVAPGVYHCQGTVTVTRPDPNRGYGPGFFQEQCGATFYDDSAAGSAALASVVESEARKGLFRQEELRRKDQEQAAALARVREQRVQVERVLAAMAAQGNPGSKQFWPQASGAKLMTRPAWRGWVIGEAEWETYDGDMKVTRRNDYGLATDGTWLETSLYPTSFRRLTATVVEEKGGKIGSYNRWQVTLALALDGLKAVAARRGISV